MNCRLHQDNQYVILLKKKGMASTRKHSRYIDIQYFFVKDMVEKGMLKIDYCPTEKMVADVMTKPYRLLCFFVSSAGFWVRRK